VVHNDGLNDVRIISAFSDVAEAAELHKSSMVDGVMKMELQEDIVIPAGGEVIFKPGDFHVMLIGLHDDMVVGEKFEAGLVLESGEEIKLNVVVKEP
jgi:copper(I)-binding protein